jgi:hypothetical protein
VTLQAGYRAGGFWQGWSINLSERGRDFWLELPVPTLFSTTEGVVIELVFWSLVAERWVHAVAEHFERQLPEGHVQLAVGDLAWLRSVAARKGQVGLRECIEDLEAHMLPSRGAP